MKIEDAASGELDVPDLPDMPVEEELHLEMVSYPVCNTVP